MTRLPTPGGDDGDWGSILNAYLSVSLASDGTLNPNVVGTSQIQAGAVTNAQLDNPTQATLASVAGKYVRPGGGIPSSDMTSAVQASLSSASTAVQLGGDLGGSNTAPTVSKLQGTTLNGSSPANGQVLTYSNVASAWVPGTPSTTTVTDATTSSKGILELAGDLGGVASSPTVLSTHLTSALPLNQGGTGSTTQNFVDLTTGQSVGGVKTFTSAPIVPSSSFPESAVTNLTTDLAAKVAKSGDTMTGKLTVPSFQMTGGSPVSGQVLTADSSGNATWGAVSGSGAQALVATGVKTSAYSAAAADFVPVDTSSGSVTITLPSTPADKTRIGVKMIAISGVNTTTIAAGGSDVFNKAGGSTSLKLTLLNQGMLLQYAASTGIWYVQADDLPAGSVALAGALDARNYSISISGGITTFNLAQMVSDAVSQNRSMYIPGGKWQPSTYNIALDNNSVNLFTFYIFGDGYESELVMPPAMTSSDSMFIANSTNSNTLLIHPRIILERFSVASASASNATFLTKHQRSLTLDTVYLTNIQNGIFSDGYSDEDRIIRLYAAQMTPGGWAYQHSGEGDAVSIQSCFTYACAGFNIINAKAIQINGLLSGWHSFTESIVDMVNFHIEGDGTTDSDPLIAIQGCNFNFGSGALYGTQYRPCVQIDDSANLRRKSRVTFSREFAFRQRLDAPGSTDGPAQCVAINIPATSGTSNLNKGSVINFNSNVCEIFGQTTTSSGSTYEEILPLITSGDSGANSITTALAAHPPLLGMDVQLRYRNATWEIAAYDPDSAVRTTRHTTQAEFIVAAAANPAGYAGDGTLVTGTTYYYTHCIYDAENRYTANSSETSATPTSGNPLIQLNFNLQFAPSKIRLWRGTTPGTYTSWVEIQASNETPQFIDQGPYIAGQAWSSTSVPAIQTTNATQDGIVVRGNGHAQIWNASPPIAGNWNAGDFCWNNTPVIGSPIGWMCTTAGSPGTWTAGPLIPGVATQTLSSDGAVTINAATGNYQTITLSANATSSTISGSRAGQVLTIGWIQDATGSRTYTWPTACKFAAGSAPSASTTATYTDQVTFIYDGTHWNETGRAVGIH